MATRQFTGKTVDEAADLALETLGLNREEVEIVVVNPGRSGILGFGGEPAEIHVTPLDESGDSAVAVEDAPDVESPAPGKEPQGRDRGSRRSRGGRGRSRSVGPRKSAGSPEGSGADAGSHDAGAAIADPVIPDDEPEPETDAAAGESLHRESGERGRVDRPERQPGPDPEVEPVAAEILEYFLSVMDVSVSTFVREDSVDADVMFEIEGEDAGLLIGRRGETLQSLQFLVNMLLNKKMDRQAYITIDVEGYQERRYESLRESADRAAERAIRDGKSQTLQPMSAADRRIIHLALADHPDVSTESRGSGNQRRVVVMLNE